MIITLQLGNQEVRIEDGELVGYEVEGHQFIHQKGSPGWSSADTEMFPIIGPVDEANFRVQVPKGEAIQDQHGHLRQFPYELIANTATTATFLKDYKENTPIANSKFPEKSTEAILSWPYSFQFKKQYTLTSEGLEVHFSISGDAGMPYMLGYHPAFKLHSSHPTIHAKDRTITLEEVLAVGSRALQVADSEEITLRDTKEITIKTRGFGHFMCWTEVPNMVCIEPITFYPYAVTQQALHRGFRNLEGTAQLKVILVPKI